ncbi:serine/threonine-protein kinase [Nannocystis pusilla]|uniref:Serine/threonine-protein kinase n=1 Tax=Nannocystis pusilla TaxID=889268 RepID=A0A9X3EZ62_9BACT|nr:serine/threonine-protein kinase [Nannocystis pusilla]MCY1013039.1 serine/threonine-protein kinase [Nannocystis pusilla]
MTVLGNRFRLLHRLGAGGMAEVYCARDRRLGREVAIKLLNAACSRDPGIIERFRQESSALARLSHPNIVTLLDTGETDDGRFYLVMERLRGEALSELFRRLRGRGEVVSWRRLVGMVRQVCMALQAAHSQQIVHRDIKPSNLFRLEHSLEGEDMIKFSTSGSPSSWRARTPGRKSRFT